MITSEMVRDLREKTGAGMMDCKKALAASNGNLDEAIRFLREKGLAAAQKKEGRIAAEGSIALLVSDQGSSMIELNCETDFVARNDAFQHLAQDIAKQAVLLGKSLKLPKESDGQELLNHPLEGVAGASLESVLVEKTATIGEKISLRRVAYLSPSVGNLHGSYVHGGGSMGVLVSLQLANPSKAKDPHVQHVAKELAMHIAASMPRFLSSKNVDAGVLKEEEAIILAQIKEQGKPEAVAKRIVEGRLDKWMREVCLLEQPFVKDPDSSVQEWLSKNANALGTDMQVETFIRFKVGEGIQKKSDDFASEVAKMAQGT